MEKYKFFDKLNKKQLESIFEWCPSYEQERILWHNSPKNGGVLGIFTETACVAYLYYHVVSIETVNIDYIEVSKIHQRKGIGSFLMRETFQFMMAKGFKIITINCVTKEGLLHARKLGFRKYNPPETYFEERSLKCDEPNFLLYISLRPSVPLRPYKEDCQLCFVVWTKSVCGEGKPDRYYNLYQNDNLPLVDYLHYDWYVGVMKNGIVLKKDKVKYFFNDHHKNGALLWLTNKDILTYCSIL